MRLRKATPADLSRLRYWDSKAHVIAATGADDSYDWASELPRDVPWREFLIAEIEGVPIGIVQVIDPADEESHYWGEIERNLRAIDIWIGEEADLGRGYGTQMMALALDRCFADPAVKAVLIDPLASNIRAHRFYERLGFVVVERRTFGSDDCLVCRLTREDWRRRKQETTPDDRSPSRDPGCSHRADHRQDGDGGGVPYSDEER
ncbi:MAG TPA: GNAT family N-acetyltransferase [Aestuariivirgaceae bacterium]|jgi:aminoglycoside 6'-N-acetyltransferase|nr:GNAT family N-acetyltransferase [Aestuariivirgaceae bacterium]